jgi:hypothetical protein
VSASHQGKIDSTAQAVSCRILSVPDSQIHEHTPAPSAHFKKTGTRRHTIIGWMRLAAMVLMLATAFCPAVAAPGPIGVSQTGRYFVDANGEPFYFLADTQWELFRRYSLSEAKLILENRKAKGFTVVMVMLTGVGDGTGANLDGHHPWLNDDPATPDPAYFTNVDAVVKLAQANDLQLLVGIYHQTYGGRMTVDNARSWAAWVTGRYRDYPNILWTLYPKATDRYKPIVSKLAEGIQEGDRGRHLVSMHPDPSPASSSFMHAEPWLGFNSIQVWNQIRSVYPMTLADYRRMPAKLVTMLEGVYEEGEEYGYPITPLLVRREAYYTCLAGGFHGYGHNDSWRVRTRWRAALDDPGAKQMTILKAIFTGLPDWWTLVPDQTVLSRGGNTNGDALNLSARSATGKWIIAYIAEQPDITVNLSKITAAGSASAKWINPATGSQEAVGTYPAAGPQSFRRPAEWQDGVLLVTADVSGQPGSASASVHIVQPKAIPAKGPLRVHPANPRYFTDGVKAILLVGSHTWGNLQDYRYATLPSPPPMDFAAYLTFLQRHNHNFFRLWAWETSFNPKAKQGTIYYDPMPYQRTGPGVAFDDQPKFDLTRFNQAYFDRLRCRVLAARDSGIYTSVMLFNGFSIESKGNVGGDPWQGHPFNPSNNVNAIDGGGSKAVHTLTNRIVTAQQEAYVRKIIDTVNDLDNVLYEITNEDSGNVAGIAWQTHMIRFIKQYEATKARQHPVGMTACYPEGNDATLLASPADWISPAAKLPVANGLKVILNDTDHSYFWTGLKADGQAAQRAWVWENFTRGNQCLFMDPYLDPSHDPGRNNPSGDQPDGYWEPIRQALGQTRSYAELMNLAAAVPHDELASTKLCLADPGKEYLVYLPEGGEVTVDLSAAAGKLNVEWMRPADGNMMRAEPISGGNRRILNAPFPGDAVLHLRTD